MLRVLITLLIAACSLSSFQTQKKKKPVLPKEFVYLPQGTFVWPNADDVYNYRKKDTGTHISMMGFYASKFEISNQQYRAFLSEIRALISQEEFAKIAVDSTGWSRYSRDYPSTGYSGTQFYHRHPSFNNFPVLNISYEGAIKYCHWLQQKIQKDNQDFEIVVSLPDKNQWYWLAGSGSFPYPWGTRSLMDKSGNRLCNYSFIDENEIVKNKENGNPQFKEWYSRRVNSIYITCAVDEFKPSRTGIYNVSGNVAEMLSEKGLCMGGSWDDYGGDVTVTSIAVYSDLSPTVGFRPIIIVTEKGK